MWESERPGCGPKHTFIQLFQLRGFCRMLEALLQHSLHAHLSPRSAVRPSRPWALRLASPDPTRAAQRPDAALMAVIYAPARAATRADASAHCDPVRGENVGV
ncbi:hypothetical protein RRG08_004764 [Elysia crispata]|uniref:Uncharacterized protein n=1 Tax=Elysia crispata TaxID=231223 RepID=A0AAE1AIK0_9GAST|nr:hypothetical protein RRG08_004764 [Elysia crispata]